MKTAATTLVLLALAGLATACSDTDGSVVAANETRADAAPTANGAMVASARPDEMAADAGAPVAASNDADMTDEGDMVATLPAKFQGRWGLTAADCDPARNDNKGLMTIGVDRIQYYESVARPLGLSMSGNKLRTELSMSGEGQSWTSRTVFELIGSGRKLVRTEESPAGAFAYTKCAA